MSRNPKKVEIVKDITKFEPIMDELTVMARSRPEDKFLLVTALKEKYNSERELILG